MIGTSFLCKYSRRSVSDYGCRHLLFFITFCLYALGMLVSMYTYTEEGNSIGIIALTAIGFLLSLGIVFKDHWQDSAINVYPFLWHITVIYCFGFLGMTYLLTLLGGEHELSPFIALFSIGFALLMLGHLVDRKVFLVGLVVSIILSNMVYRLGLYDEKSSAYAVLSDNNSIRIFTLIVTSGSVLFALFCTGSRKPDIDYLDTLLFILSRDLMHYTSNVVGIGKSHASIISMCIQSSKVTKSEKDDQVTMSMAKNIFYTLEENVAGLSETHDRGQEIMRYRISVLGCKINREYFGYYNVNDCIREALLYYENVNDLQYKLPSVHIKQDFTFFGSDKHFRQAIMHLLSYSYWRCEKEDEDRHIWVENNKIHYYYTGLQIRASDMLDLFSYPTNPEEYLTSCESLGEVGILYYVRKVMEAFGGDVICNSDVKRGVRYMHFTLTFPKVNKNDKTRDNKSNIPAK